ncbi:phage portal protein [Rhizobium sp. WW_1]|jgi:HK97 family phage portal protein|uniref:phage portal protein n=1 Tax=Rhizobium sp. WW_1 TaxID=1907375 RepID=UPI00068AF927|nr:phage portal protein [Rhizobium sp. WW_1]RKD61546.1 HK97 family phage portal protein [Rhizobium sp. WW_1]
MSKRRVEKRESIENPTVPVSSENFLSFFGMGTTKLPRVTIDRALTVPAVLCAVAFLSRTLAALPLHAYRRTNDSSVKLTGKLQTIIHENPNDQMDSFKFRQYFWQQVFTGGRGLAWIERSGASFEHIWPMDPARTSIRRVGIRGELVYSCDGIDYHASDVIDVPFMLRSNMTGHYGPIALAGKAIQLALAMNDYAATFFAGGGIPPLALEGPMPAGKDAMARAMADIHRSVDEAKNADKPVFPIPPGYKLNPVGFDPAKGQMTEARRFQNEEFARAWQMPLAFMQDLTKGTFNNVEQQDINLVKHLIMHWATALEGELNLKLWGRMNDKRYVEHNLDGLQRGDFLSRLNGLARAIQTAQLTPNEARGIENRPRHDNPAADQLLVQGATVVLGTSPAPGTSIPSEPSAESATPTDGANDDNQD